MIERPAQRRVGITGASGYIGRALIARSLPRHWTPVSLGRTPLASEITHRNASLNEVPGAELIDGLDALVHLAADTKGSGDPAREIAFARALAGHARSRGIPLIFVSSQAASPGAPTAYGRTKYAIEQAVLPLGATAIRPGLVYGGEERALFGALAGFLRRFRIVPKLLPSPDVQPIHVDDLGAAIVAALEDDTLRGRVLNVAGMSMPFDQFLRLVARYRVRRAAVMIPLPVGLLRRVVSLVGRMLGPRLSASRLDSLVQLPPLVAEPDLRQLRVDLRDVRDGLSPSGRNRARLLREGHGLARAVTGARHIPAATLRRYLRALPRLGQYAALDIPPFLLRNPRLLASLDASAARASAGFGTIAGRMGVMCRLCESDPGLARYFVVPEASRSMARTLSDFVSAATAEAFARLLAPLARRLQRYP